MTTFAHAGNRVKYYRRIALTFLLTYDLNRPGQNYPGLTTALEQAGAVRILYSTWLVASNESALQLINRYQAHLDANDRVFACAVGNWAYNNIMNVGAATRLLPP